MSGRVLPAAFYERDAREVAPELLHKVLVHGTRAARIVEVEAYMGADDPGSHAYRGRTPRTEVMFGPAGHLYVYFSYGMHWCANAVCGDDGVAMAVLFRAGAPVAGLDEMRRDRPAARSERDLCSGPGKLCQALGIDKTHNGANLMLGAPSAVHIVDDGVAPPAQVRTSTRIGLSAGAEAPWRWFVAGDPNLSRRG